MSGGANGCIVFGAFEMREGFMIQFREWELMVLCLICLLIGIGVGMGFGLA